MDTGVGAGVSSWETLSALPPKGLLDLKSLARPAPAAVLARARSCAGGQCGQDEADCKGPVRTRGEGDRDPLLPMLRDVVKALWVCLSQRQCPGVTPPAKRTPLWNPGRGVSPLKAHVGGQKQDLKGLPKCQKQ